MRLITLILASACGGCVSVPSAPNCDVASLADVFANPIAFFGKTFCGEALAVPEGRSLKIFPPGPVPEKRNDVVMFLDKGAIRLLNTHSEPFSLYVEGSIRGDRVCFVRDDITCLPYNRPFALEVRRLSVR